MPTLTEEQLLLALIALAVILLLSRSAGELARRIGQPEVLGELFAGFLLGPSILGAFLPRIYHTLFLNAGAGLVLSGFSWIGAILLLLIAGMEVDLAILRAEAKSGALAAALAIIPSLIAGTFFASIVLHRTFPGGTFLGIVLSVTAVSVAAKIMLERGTMRRRYAQVIVAAGVASEVIVWLQVSVVSSLHSSSPLLAGAIHTGAAILFFLAMMTVGRRLVFWAMRRVADAAWIVQGQLTLVLILTFGAAAITQSMGLHALLGAFVFGVLLSQSPRANRRLLESVHGLTVSFFAPIFFALAGMRVNVLQLGTVSAIETIVLLFAVATLVKVGLATLGARLGGLGGWESALVGLGLNLKGGTDVIVAIVGVELGLLSGRAYSMYAVVSILTVLLSPSLLTWLERKAPPSADEEERLQKEEAALRSYVPSIERVLVPLVPALLPSLAASVVERVAASKDEERQIFDITKFTVEAKEEIETVPMAAQAHDRLNDVAGLRQVQVTERSTNGSDVADAILQAARGYDLIALGAHPPEAAPVLSFGSLHDQIVHRADADVLVTISDDEQLACSTVRRILVPTNGLEYSMAAGDIAAALAHACGAEVVILTVVRPDEEMPAHEPSRSELASSAAGMVRELTFRTRRLGVAVSERVEVGENPGATILEELERGEYQMVVLGGVDRGTDDRPYLGSSITSVLTKNRTPALLLVSHA